MADLLTVVEAGRVDYLRGLALQSRLVELRRAGTVGDVLLLLEHPPVLTLGRHAGERGGRQHLLVAEEQLASHGLELHVVNRGGDLTYHGPGQLVGYPIFDLRAERLESGARLGVVDFVRRLEEVLIRVAGQYGVCAGRVPGRTGVWTTEGVAERKLAAIGVHVSGGITSHGFALNVTTDLRDFALIVPCGIADRSVTSLEQESDCPLSLWEVSQTVTRQFGKVWSRQVLAVEDLPALHRDLVGC